jgi:hypothetical protein
MGERVRLNIDVDPRVAATLRRLAAEAQVAEGKVVEHAIRAYSLRALLSRVRANSDLDEDQAMALANEELKALRAARRPSC